MRKYFVQLLKKNLLPLACLTLLCVIVYVVPIAAENYYYWNTYTTHVNLYYEYLAVALGCLSVLIPIYLFSYKMNKRSVDMYYSLPISRTKILVANFLVGLIMLYVSYTIAYLLGFMVIAARVQHLYLVYYLPLYFASLIPAFILYAVAAFVYTRANTVIDGIISVIGVLFLLTMLFSAYDTILRGYDVVSEVLDGEKFLPFGALLQANAYIGRGLTTNKVGLWFSERRINHTGYRAELLSDIYELMGDILWLLLAVAATVALIVTEKNCKAENCGQTSESIFSFKVLIPAYTALLTILTLDNEEYTLLFVVLFAAFVLSVIYKRKINIGWKFAVVLAACVMGAAVLYYVSTAILDVYRGYW